MGFVSVIIPFRDVVEYLVDALNSLAYQTYRDFEVILVDDGSESSCPDFVGQWEGRFDISLLKTEPKGVSSARNAGLKACRGEFVAFLDADDIWLPRKIERQVALLSKSFDYDGVYCNAFLIDGAGKFIGRTRASQAGIPFLPEGTVRLSWADKIITSTVLLRKTSIDQTGGFDERLRIAEDWDFFLRKPFRLLCIQEPLILYRRHSRSVGKIAPKGYLDAIKVVESHYAKSPHIQNREKRIVSAQIYINECGNLFRNGKFLGAVVMFLKAIRLNPASVLNMAQKAIYVRMLRRKEEENFKSKAVF